jgi:RNA ligase (TIGR02306 family)
MRNKWYRRFFTKAGKRGWPKFIQKTDEERIQKIPWICEKEKDTVFTATEKLDGQSATYALLRVKRWWWKDKFEFIVCSRNIHLKKPNNSSYWTIAKQLNIENILKKLILNTDEYIILQGEIIGEGIQKNKYEIKGYDFYAFNLIHSYDNKKLPNYFMNIYLSFLGIKCVPLVNNHFKLKDDIHECIKDAKGISTINPKIYREGIVVRNYEKDISFKIINPDFLLKYDNEDEDENNIFRY